MFHLECLRTILAFVWPLSSMGADMVDHAMFLFKSTRTNGTYEVANIGMDFEVLLQIRFSCKIFVTDWAFKQRIQYRLIGRNGRFTTYLFTICCGIHLVRFDRCNGWDERQRQWDRWDKTKRMMW
eukprot:795909_1